ncbi:MAG TPA: PH domain-containing protein [Bryobacteraceae bacterium]|nr:PH domain-containing protein [Bryobacteraceae bacterium]
MPSNERFFAAAPYDRLAKAVTTLVCGLLLVVALLPSMPWPVALLGILLVLFTYLYSPRGYVVAEGRITVRRVVGAAVVPLDGLIEARPAASDDLDGCIRLWGNGGMFGYYGLFRTARLGACRWYVTDRSKVVVAITDRKTSLFSPDDPEAFLAAIGARPGSAAPAAPRAENPRRTPFGAMLGGLVGLAAIAVVAWATLYSPGPPRYTVTRDSLAIHDRFYPVTLKADAVDVGAIRVVDLSREPEWRAVSKTNGFNNSHYQSGWFRLANGSKVEMYRAGGEQLLLVPGKANGVTVLLQVSDPEGLAGVLRSAWAGR